jgi:PAS domain S-box-containing protein
VRRSLEPVGQTTFQISGPTLQTPRIGGSVEPRSLQGAVDQTEERFRRAIESSPTGLLIADEHGTIVTVNPAMVRLSGYSRAELIGQRVEMLVPEHLHARHLEERRAYTSNPTARRMAAGREVTLRRRNGELIVADIALSPKFQLDESVLVLAFVDDGTPRLLAEKALQESEERLRNAAKAVTDRERVAEARSESELRFRVMADEAPVIIWVTDVAGRILFVNREYRVYFGDRLGADGLPIVHPDDEAYNRALQAAVRSQATFGARARMRRADGEWRWIASYGTPRYSDDHEFLGLVATSQDVTEPTRIRELEQEVARQKDQFVAVLAHELRNPLAPIRTSVAIMRGAECDDPLILRCRDVIDRQAALMGRLLDDLLDVSRLSRGKLMLQRAPVLVQDVVDAAVEVSRPLLDQQRHTFTVDNPHEGLAIDGDRVRLIQVLGNLLTNAAKYTAQGGRIHLSVRCDAGHVLISVLDSGVGIAPDMLEVVFDLFAQGEHAADQPDSGLGIGLALARRLVEMHGGAIHAMSPGPGYGSEFVVRLPIGDVGGSPDRSEPGPDPKRDASRPPRRVLVADDNADAADMLATFFDQLGNQVRTVYGGEAAVAEAEAFAPDVVVLDIGMPSVDGVQACRRIRQEPWGARMLIVALTGWGQDEDRRRTADAGFDLHVVKPVDPVDLMERIQELESRRSGGSA